VSECGSQHDTEAPHLLDVIRVLLADDSSVYARELAAELGEQDDLEIIKIVDTAEDAVEAAAELKPDVVLLDLGMPEMGSVEACRRIVNHAPAITVVVVTGRTKKHLADCIAAGAKAYVEKKDGQDPLYVGAALRSAVRGDVVADRDMIEEVRSQARQRRLASARDSHKGAELTAREQEVLVRIARGDQNKQIADVLEISIHTVEHHVDHILTKLRVPNRTAAVDRGRQLGYLP
jgi:DNA-binding NarL/FixJ family response regulator